MAPNKRKNAKTKAKTNKKIKVPDNEKNDSNEDMAITSIEDLNSVSNGLRRSKRVSAIKPIKTNGKSKYFSESEDKDQSDDSDDNDQEFKPEVKPKQSIVRPKKAVQVKSDSDSSSDDGEDWEEVMDIDQQPLKDYKPDIPTEGVQITLGDSSNVKKKKSVDINDLIRQRINRFKRDLQLNKHKTSLLLYISRAVFLNNLVNDDLIKAISLSLTINDLKAPKRLSLKFLNEFTDWFKNNFKFRKTEVVDSQPLIETLVRCLHDRKAQTSLQINLIFLSLVRSVAKFTTRLCMALNPVQMKPTDLILSQKQMEVKNKSKPGSSKAKVSKKSVSKKRKVVSSESESEFLDSEDETSNKKKATKTYLEIWIELYVDSERKWICLDLSNDLVDKPLEIASKSLPNLSYVIGVDSDGYIKDVTQRYIKDWMSAAMKRRRIDQKWWAMTLEAFQKKGKSTADKAEESEFDEKLSSTPLPTKISEYKNHPLYVIKKDLLKFQGIYPSDAPPLGFIRGEPVYARECVQLLRSRETWLRFARTVRVGETPYKVVKSRPKWDKYAKTWRRDLPLELFGEWQTEAYDPPEAKDGKVPRNGYGNIDLFQPQMLPKGCVHLRLPGLARVANKLKIDCVPAIVAFDNNNGGLGSHPVMDGYVVCKEYEEVLVAAWEEEQEIAQQRQIEKREKRIYDNWRKLIKGLLIREKVRKKYENNEEEDDETDIEGDD